MQSKDGRPLAAHVDDLNAAVAERLTTAAHCRRPAIAVDAGHDAERSEEQHAHRCIKTPRRHLDSISVRFQQQR